MKNKICNFKKFSTSLLRTAIYFILKRDNVLVGSTPPPPPPPRISAVLIVVLLLSGFCFAAGKSVYSYWYDESKNVLEINNFDDFAEFQRLLWKEQITFKDKEVHLKTDIIVFDTTDSDTWAQKIKPKDFKEKEYLFPKSLFKPKDLVDTVGKVFLHPVRDEKNGGKFYGKFDGNGHYIRGFYGRSLFEEIDNALIQNLNISHSLFFIASIAVNSDNSLIKNCNVSANINTDYINIGGICGKIKRTTIRNSSFNGNAKPQDSFTLCGGLIGDARKSSILDNNKTSGTVIGGVRKTGGIAGKITPSSVAINNEADNNIIEKSRFTFGLETGYSFGMGQYGINTFDNNISWGIMINRYLSLALAGGFQMATIKKTNGIKYSSNSGNADNVIIKVIKNEKYLPKDDILYNKTDFFIPIFLKPRFYLSEKGISPFVDADVGIMLCWGEDWYMYKNPPGHYFSYEYKEDHEFYSSFYFNPSVGVQMRYFTVSLGYKMWVAEYKKLLPGEDGWNLDNLIDTYERGGIIKRPNGAISLKIGFGF